jgi:hypothetical protein
MQPEFKDATAISFHLKLPYKKIVEHWTNLPELNSILDGTYTPNQNALKPVIDFLNHVSQKIHTEHAKHLNRGNIIMFLTHIKIFFKYEKFIKESETEKVFRATTPIEPNMFNANAIKIFRDRERLTYFLLDNDSDAFGVITIRIISEDHLIVSYENAQTSKKFNTFINTTSFINLLKEYP